MSEIISVLDEKRVFNPTRDQINNAAISGMDNYLKIVEDANKNYPEFWAKHASELISWHKQFTQILNESNAPFYKWFEDGELNVSYNCLDRHIEKHGNKTAIIFEADDGSVAKITYKELLTKVGKFANGLRSLGFSKGDRIIIYMPMSIEAVCVIQACLRLGLTHSVVFGGFSAKSLQERIIDAGAVAVITADEQVRGGKHLGLKAVVEEAINMGRCESIQKIIVYQRTANKSIPFTPPRDIWLDELIKDQPEICEPEWVSAEHPSFILYTSGSTGKPKGVQHSTAGYLLHAILTMLWTFDLKNDDIFWCTADIGWITGHTYVAYGPLACAATQVIFEGLPTYPNASRFWQIIEKHKISIFYTAPTAIRSLIKLCEQNNEVHPSKYNLSSLRILGSVGEPINPEAWIWYYKNVGGERCPILDTFWQTETGGHVITPLPGVTPLVPGSCTLPFPGIMIDVVDKSGKDINWGKGGYLVIKKPWPSMIRTIWGDPQRFKDSYFPTELGGATYLVGDGAVRNEDNGYITIMGRIDDVLNVSGHRLGTMEIESALVANPMVTEAAVVGKPHEIKGESIVAFVVLNQTRPTKEDAEKISDQLKMWVTKEISPIAKPEKIYFGDNLPKTRSGKIMRRLLRNLAEGKPIKQDISTLENPAILEQFK